MIKTTKLEAKEHLKKCEKSSKKMKLNGGINADSDAMKGFRCMERISVALTQCRTLGKN